MAKISKTNPKKHSLRVASWVYEVINPLLEIIPIELSFLHNGSTTFRLYNKKLEFIRSLESYLSSSARHIYRDFLYANADATKQLSFHDELVHTLEMAAQESFTSLSNNPGFIDKVKCYLNEYLSAKQPYPDGAYQDEQFPLLVAEHVINRVVSIPEHFTDSKFWDQYGMEFLKFYIGHKFDRLNKACKDLLNYDEALMNWLQKKSQHLCETYDIPAAPIHNYNV
ncbi:MAG: hypothetical protein E3K37_01665 [Candidatus Kuenenia sp.]|nr:hypothetical protein [Candidatus Kuenenia hertensis]